MSSHQEIGTWELILILENILSQQETFYFPFLSILIFVRDDESFTKKLTFPLQREMNIRINKLRMLKSRYYTEMNILIIMKFDYNLSYNRNFIFRYFLGQYLMLYALVFSWRYLWCRSQVLHIIKSSLHGNTDSFHFKLKQL